MIILFLMLTDVHCHPFDLFSFFPQAEEERRRLGVMAVANSCHIDEFAFNEKLAKKASDDNAAPLLPCLAIHPQIFAGYSKAEKESEQLLLLIDKHASEKRIAAIGEFGFDLFNAAYKETEKEQDYFYAAQIEISLKYDLPVILHVRRAMHKIFNNIKNLAKCKSVIFHSWPGTLEEGGSLLRRGVNAYFSFGNTIMLNHKQAIRCCSLFPADRLLTETDAPYVPQRGQIFSMWSDLPQIIETIATLRKEAGSILTEAKELENQIEINFRNLF